MQLKDNNVIYTIELIYSHEKISFPVSYSTSESRLALWRRIIATQTEKAKIGAILSGFDFSAPFTSELIEWLNSELSGHIITIEL